MTPNTLSTLLGLMATALCSQAQELSSSDTFVLYPYITSGTIESGGRYTNKDIDRRAPLASSSGRNAGEYTTDCFNRNVFTTYIGPTHCYAEIDQCGYKRWSLNHTYPDAGENGYAVTSVYAGSSLLIAPLYEVDDLGRRDVGWSGDVDECGLGFPTSGLKFEQDGEDGIVHLTYENQEDSGDVFGTFMACYPEGELYGPKLFYRNSDAATPEGCAELMLVPRCATDPATAHAPVKSQCYQGGLPA